MNIDRQIYYWAHMLDEAFNARFLCEDLESKNIARAEKWIMQNHPQLIGQTFGGTAIKTPRDVITVIRDAVPNVRLPYDKDADGKVKITMHRGQPFKKATCKWIEGVTRMYFELMSDPENAGTGLTRLDKIIELMAENPEEYPDGKLAGVSYESLNDRFGPQIEELLRKDKEELSKQTFQKKTDYKIVPIDSFEEAQEYSDYMGDNIWCITCNKEAYDSYTKMGTGRFYFCLMPGFENIEAVPGENCPMDEYGRSMIAISVNDDGSLNTCTCRWNHSNGGDDHVMDTKQISEFFGLNFYKTFLPYPPEQLLDKFHELEDEPDEFAQTLGFIKCKNYDNDIGNVTFYVKIENGKLIKAYKIADNIVNINGKIYSLQNRKLVKGAPQTVEKNFNCFRMKITSLEGMPQVVKGNFDCSNTKITSLKGAPQRVDGDFRCTGITITSLEGAPQIVGGDFDCRNIQIISLKGAPQVIGGSFYCSSIKLTSLKGAPQKVGGDFDCSYTGITSLEGAPQTVGGSFNCSRTNIMSLEGAPQKVRRDFYCSDTKITSLEGAPQTVGGDFYCSDTKITSLEGAPQTVGGDFYCDGLKIISLEGAPQKVGRSFYCSRTKITSLEGVPQKVGENFICSYTNIMSLKGMPQTIGGNFDCSYTGITSLEGAPLIVEGYFDCSDTKITSLKGAPQRVDGYVRCRQCLLSKQQIDDYESFLRNPTPEHMDETGHYVP